MGWSCRCCWSISIHALHEEGDVICAGCCKFSSLFLSTPSMRRATSGKVTYTIGKFISIHALHEEGDQACQHCVYASHDISIHALHEEGDRCVPIRGVLPALFLSTPSMRRATPVLRLWVDN